MSKFYEERVLSVHHWTDNLFSFRTTRDPAFRFRNGEFTMIGLEVEGRPLLRAYSVVSANYEAELEFFSIKVQDGPLTSKLQHLKVGDEIEAMIVNVDRKTRGINLSIKAKDSAEQHEAMQKLASESSAASGTTNLGALLKAKLNQQG